MDLTLIIVIENVCIGLLIGIAIGITGIGGGVLMEPALIHILNLSPVTAVGTGLAYAMITKIGGTISHFKLKTIQGKKVLYFLIGSIPGVVFASRSVNILIKQAADPAKINAYLQIVIGIVISVAAIVILIQIVATNNKVQTHQPETSKQLPLSRSKIVITILSGLLIGGLVGATSVGGGVLIIPVFLILLNSTTKQAVGSSIVISLVLSTLGGVVYFLGGNVHLLYTLFLCTGSLPGVYLGSRLSVNVPDKILKIIVTVIVTFSGISLFFGVTSH